MQYLIGIDPGINTGFAVLWKKENRLIECRSTDFWGALQSAEEWGKNFEIKVIVEKPGTKAVWHQGAQSQAAKNRTAVNVGSVIREAELIIERMKILGIECHVVPPKGKVTSAHFRRVTGWNFQTNQHARDAAMLLY